jgi:CTP:phosphocholine cytidylyltransferase-like protein
MIEYVVGSLSKVCGEIVVVTGTRERLDYLTGKYENLRLAYNENLSGGMFGSVLTGFGVLTADFT